MSERFEVERVPNSEAEALRRGPTGGQLFWRLGEAWRVVPSSTEPWVWRGMAGHFICADQCCFRLHTTVGKYRVSTVGCYHPRSDASSEPHEIGVGRLFETMVFENSGDDFIPSELDVEGYNTPEDAERGHIRMCEKWAEGGSDDR